VSSLVQIRNKKLINVSMNTRAISILKEPNVPNHQSYIQDKYAVNIVNNIVFCINHITYTA